ncbi:MAG: leucine-rich repeat protein [Lachnospiraceae bacterium]|nr:leucine-rich repeat protein [Lachnospiraceae bacterium]
MIFLNVAGHDITKHKKEWWIMKAGRKWLLSLLIFTVLVCAGVSQDVSAAEAYSYSNIVVYNIDGTTNSLSDYSEDMVELVYGGMTACDYVGQMLAVGEKAVAQGISIRPVLMDYASKSDSLKSYANQHPTVTVAYSPEYIKHPFSYVDNYYDGFTIPMVLVFDRTGSLVYKSEGPEPEALGDFLGIDVGEMPHYVEETENSGRCGARLTWKLDSDGTLTISGKGEMYDDAWVSWMGREDIKKVVIENGATNISQFAFSGCVNLTSVTIPGSVTSIDPYAFRWCSSLTGLTIPDGVLQIGMYAFLGCTDLTSIRIPGSVADIEKNPFAGCENLESITVDGENPNYRSINGVLYDADKTALIAYPTAKQSSSYVVPDGVLHIGDEAFSYCDHLTGVILPDSVTDIGYHAFGRCSSLTDLTIPDQVTELGSLAFLGCSSLTGIHIPDSVTGIGKNAFAECTSLEQITVGEKNQNYVSLDGILLNKGKSEIIVFPEAKQTIGDEAFKDCDKLKSVAMPEGVTSIGDCAFKNCRSLNSVSIPDSVTYIGNEAFTGCSNLGSITIPNNVTNIGNQTFAWCSKLGSITIPNSVISIEDGAFLGCSKLANVTIPESVTSIGDSAFSYCTNLDTITVDTKNQNYTSVDGVLFDKAKTTLIAYPARKQNRSYTIPESVNSIEKMAFYQCSNLSRITISDNVNKIGHSAFRECSSMTSITIPKSVSYIGNYALGYQGLSSESKMENYTIYGHTGTEAETYANNNGFKFVDLDAPQTNDSQKADNSQKAENANQTDEKKDESGWYYVFDITQLGWGNDGFTWYYLDADGNIQTGWLNIAGVWYYMDQSGAMQTGWVNDGGTWYYMNYWGEMQTGWVYAGGSWYYLSGSGAMQTGWISDGGTWYYTDGSGAMQTGWINDGDAWYYLNGIGAMVTGWQFAGGKWYYLDGSGAMRTGWLNDGGKWYYLNASGAMQTGWYSVSGKWYYSYASGQMAANTRIGSYRVNASGEWVR